MARRSHRHLSRADDWRFGEGVAVSGDESTIAVTMTNGWRADIPRVVVYEKPATGWADDSNAADNAELKDSSHPYLRQEVRAVADADATLAARADHRRRRAWANT